MDIFTIAIWIGTIIFLIFSLTKNREKTKNALRMAFGMGKSMILSILSIILLIGLVLAILPPEQIAGYVENQNVLIATIVSALFRCFLSIFIKNIAAKKQHIYFVHLRRFMHILRIVKAEMWNYNLSL